ncbi:MAG: hypothetical protein SP1CHLAM54_06790 [Chlamydiia bacterium]|nr:hypothetical protein [Chlamydiia bacterium]MCH9615587.1 hypothetical protein [Chlamydiia bacterium]MCH9629242.1 hypothetical protein [Chlamydiia bacterium]
MFHLGNLFQVLLLVFLEGALSIDNALIISTIVKKLPEEKRRKALFIGVGSAFILRFVAIVIAVKLIHFFAFQLIGAAYLLYLAFRGGMAQPKITATSLFKAVIMIEIVDFLFAFDSITAGVGIVGLPPKLWIIYLGGVLGIIMMRFASSYFVKIMDRFPALEKSSHIIVGATGLKLLFEAFHLFPWWAEIIFWLVVVLAIFWGCKKEKSLHR